jgi:hypothetical protein
MRLTAFLFASLLPIIAFTSANEATAQTSTYVNPQFGFTVRYPQTATIPTGGVQDALMVTTNLVVAFTLTLPPGTNLIEADTEIGVSADPAVVSTCTAAVPSRDEKAAGTAIIGGATFTRFTSSDHGMGKTAEYTVYRAVHAGTCYELAEMLYYEINGFGLAPGQVDTARPFDETKIMSSLEAITQSFAFAP